MEDAQVQYLRKNKQQHSRASGLTVQEHLQTYTGRALYLIAQSLVRMLNLTDDSAARPSALPMCKYST